MNRLALPPPPTSWWRKVLAALGRGLRDPELRSFWIGLASVLGAGLALMIAGVALQAVHGGWDPFPPDGSKDPAIGQILFVIGFLPWAWLFSMVLFWGMLIAALFSGLWLLIGLLVGIEALYLRATRGRWTRPSLFSDEEPEAAYSSHSSSRPPRDPPARHPARDDPLGHYGALGIDPRASNLLARHAYRRQAMRHHPDQGGDLARMQRINSAWEVIGNPERRAAYDMGRLDHLGWEGAC